MEQTNGRKPGTAPAVAPPVTPLIHRRITYGMVLVGLLLRLASLFGRADNLPTLGIIEEGEWQELLDLQATLMENDDFFTVSVNRNNRTSLPDRTVLKDLNIELWTKTSCSKNRDYCQQLMMETARLAFDQYDNIEICPGCEFLSSIVSTSVRQPAALPRVQRLASKIGKPN